MLRNAIEEMKKKKPLDDSFASLPADRCFNYDTESSKDPDLQASSIAYFLPHGELDKGRLNEEFQDGRQILYLSFIFEPQKNGPKNWMIRINKQDLEGDNFDRVNEIAKRAFKIQNGYIRLKMQGWQWPSQSISLEEISYKKGEESFRTVSAPPVLEEFQAFVSLDPKGSQALYSDGGSVFESSSANSSSSNSSSLSDLASPGSFLPPESDSPSSSSPSLLSDDAVLPGSQSLPPLSTAPSVGDSSVLKDRQCCVLL